MLSQPKSSVEGYWDRVAEETRNKGNVKLSARGEDWIGFKNWVTEYADMKTKDFLLKTRAALSLKWLKMVISPFLLI